VNLEDPTGEASLGQYLSALLLSVSLAIGGPAGEAELPHVEVEVEYMFEEAEKVLENLPIPGPPTPGP
jgi:hypothetical protein